MEIPCFLLRSLIFGGKRAFTPRGASRLAGWLQWKAWAGGGLRKDEKRWEIGWNRKQLRKKHLAFHPIASIAIVYASFVAFLVEDLGTHFVIHFELSDFARPGRDLRSISSATGTPQSVLLTSALCHNNNFQIDRFLTYVHRWFHHPNQKKQKTFEREDRPSNHFGPFAPLLAPSAFARILAKQKKKRHVRGAPRCCSRLQIFVITILQVIQVVASLTRKRGRN